MSIKASIWSDLPAGLHRLELRTGAITLPLLVARGPVSGPVLAVTAAIHGDEFEGVQAIHEVFDSLNPLALRGALAAVPVANPNAHRACTRENPVDDKNLARVFPGNDSGTESEQIAAALSTHLIAHADFYLDLHSGGVRFAMPSMAGYWSEDPRAHVAAEIFGAPLIWAHPNIDPGRTISLAKELGIPFLYTEARGSARIHPEDLLMMKRGIVNLLRHLHILEGAPDVPAPPRRLSGDGNTDAGIRTNHAGFFIPEAELLETVHEGQRIGRLTDLHGRILELFHAPRRGVVALRREMPAVAVGDTVFILAEEA